MRIYRQDVYEPGRTTVYLVRPLSQHQCERDVMMRTFLLQRIIDVHPPHAGLTYKVRVGLYAKRDY